MPANYNSRPIESTDVMVLEDTAGKRYIYSWEAVSKYIRETQFGISPNYTDFANDGTLRAHGNATAWRDMIGDLFGKKLNSDAGKIDYDWAENAIKFQSGGDISDVKDRVQSNLEFNHDLLIGDNVEIRPHLHYFQDVASSAVGAFTFTMEYRLQQNGAEKEASWTAVTCVTGTDDLFDFTGEADGTYNNLLEFAPIILTKVGLSDTFQFRIARTDSNVGDVLVYFMDLHAKVNSFGSDEEYVKE